jgi:hypothetical protein
MAIGCCIRHNECSILSNMPAKEIMAAIRELERAGWRVATARGHAHAYAKAYCPGGRGGCQPVLIYGTPRVPEHEASRIMKALENCQH